ncbi:helix-turn-helix domain-containing protein, partial [Myxococcota bacterium]|nr:helix-turn-helix domain-containing protein [Myxococcota bacterium]
MITSWDKMKVADHMQQIIEAHLMEPVTLHILTKGTGYSMYHAAKMFKEVTGETPFAYLRKRRISEAACSLSAGDRRIIDVALDFVFDSHEGFTRAFARQFGMTPRGFMNNRPPLSLFFPPSMRSIFSLRQKGEYGMTKTNDSKKVQPIFVQIMERPARKLVLKRAPTASHYFEYCDEVGCDIFEQLGAIQDALHEPMGLWLPEAMRQGHGEYAQGVEVSENWNG